MKRWTLFLGVAVVLILALGILAGASIVWMNPANPVPQPTMGQAGIANPASTYCVERGYRSVIRNGQSGQTGVCVFPDGSECDEWAFFRGECGVKWLTPTK